MNTDFKIHVSDLLNESITNISPVSGGDISKAYRINTPTNSYFLKLNNAPHAFRMFQTEAYGLELIAKSKTIKTPKIINYGNFGDSSFLLLEFIESKLPTSEDFKTLGKQLAKLHQCASNTFGLDLDNFIGSLEQHNTQHDTWIDFYTHERLKFQLDLAKQKGLLQDNECPTSSRIKTQLQSLFSDVKPSLLHGDLWSGNYLIAKDGMPYLIDPAVYYGHHEVDIAMSKLFGGFGDSFYEAYYNYFPVEAHTSARIEIYQLYYLLVHLNMFGRSYYGSVVSILKTYF